MAAIEWMFLIDRMEGRTEWTEWKLDEGRRSSLVVIWAITKDKIKPDPASSLAGDITSTFGSDMFFP